MNSKNPEDRIYTPAEVAALFRVDAKTVTRWANAGRIEFFRTIGGHRRFTESAIREATARANDGLAVAQ